MKWLSRWFGPEKIVADHFDVADASYDRAMQLSNEVICELQERTRSKGPYRVVLAELLFGRGPLDTALIVDAFEAAQESRIYRGPVNGHG